MEETRLRYLYFRYFRREASPVEQAEFLSLAAQDGNREEILRLMDESWATFDLNSDPFAADTRERILHTVFASDSNGNKPLRKKVLRLWPRVAAAAAVLMIMAVSTYWFVHHRESPTVARQSLPDDIAPGTTRPVLTLANGHQIVLDTAADGTLAVQGNVNVSKRADGQIVYSGNAAAVNYNTLTAPKGSRPVRILLADGTAVWLNVGSAITFPTAFVSKERRVRIDGEAYFEVAHDAAKPFLVQHGGMQVRVLGTHFDVNTYSDESMAKVTLLQGRVDVSEGRAKALLAPGQQAQLHGTNINVSRNVDMEEVMAWKNGKFQFGDRMDIPSIMRQIARWYDVDIEYRGNITGHIGGSISRQVNASQVLKLLEATGAVHFRIEGKKVIVMPGEVF